MIIRNDDNIHELINSTPRVVVQFSASWCYPCRLLKPRLEEIENSNSAVTFVYVDIEGAQEFAKASGIMSVPTVIGYLNGSKFDRVDGANEAAIRDLVQRLTETGQ